MRKLPVRIATRTRLSPHPASRSKAGHTLVEVIVASGVLAVLLVPIFMTWMTAAQTAAQDSREVLAANLCAEIIEQVIGIRRMNGYLLALGKEGGHEAIDIDELRTKEPKSVGFTLYPTPCCARTSRVYLADLPQGFTRTLSIQPEVVGGENGFFAPQIIWRITARVVFETPRNRGAIERDVALTTLIMDEKRGRDS